LPGAALTIVGDISPVGTKLNITVHFIWAWNSIVRGIRLCMQCDCVLLYFSLHQTVFKAFRQTRCVSLKGVCRAKLLSTFITTTAWWANLPTPTLAR